MGSVWYREQAPPPSLSPYVTCFWAITGGVGAHRVLPDGAMDVVVEPGAGARVVGPMTCAIVTDSVGPAWIVGVRFQPGAAPGLVEVAARELRDAAAPAADVWGAPGRALDARLADARGPEETIAVLQAHLTARLSRARAPDERVRRAVHALRAFHGELPIPAVAARVGVGERQLERLFDEHVGYGPKAFARVARLQRVVGRLVGPGGPHGPPAPPGRRSSWASLATECGYADQAHLIREFRSLVGLTPAAYASRRAVSEIDNPRERPDATFGA